MTTYDQAGAPSNAFKQPRVVDGDRMLGATLLSLVLGIWVTLAFQGMSSDPSQPMPGGAGPLIGAVATQVQVGERLSAREGVPLDTGSAHAEARRAAPQSR